MTELQRRRLAKEARKFALECVNGTAPLIGRGRKFDDDGNPCCAAGHIQHRARAPEAVLGTVAFRETCLLFDANDRAYSQAERRMRIVFPLLALADALEGA